MKRNDMSTYEKGCTLNAIGIAMGVGVAVASSITVLVVAILFAPWPIKVAAGIVMLYSAFLAGAAYYETR